MRISACGIVILISLMDSTIREEGYLLEKYKDIPVLATVPDLIEDSGDGYYGYGTAYARSGEKARSAANVKDNSKKDKEKGSEV